MESSAIDKSLGAKMRKHPSNEIDWSKRQRLDMRSWQEEGGVELKTIVERVWMENKGIGIFHDLLPFRTLNEKNDRMKYCDFHKDYGHITQEYRALNGQVRAMICKGQLSHYVQKATIATTTPPLPGPTQVAASTHAVGVMISVAEGV